MKKVSIGVILFLIIVLAGCDLFSTQTETTNKRNHVCICESYEVIREPSCQYHGEKSGICKICGKTVVKEIQKLNHTLTEDDVKITPSQDIMFGFKSKKCIICGEYSGKKLINLTQEEQSKIMQDLEKTYDSDVTTDMLERTPDKYKGEKISFLGKIVQVCYESTDGSSSATYRINKSNTETYYIKLILGKSGRILEDDWVALYGTFDGLLTYESIFGKSITIPSINVLYYKNYGKDKGDAWYSHSLDIGFIDEDGNVIK